MSPALRLAVSCPTCHRRPNLRTFPGVRDLFRGKDPDAPVQMVRCPGCTTIYTITVRAFQCAAA